MQDSEILKLESVFFFQINLMQRYNIFSKQVYMVKNMV